jgi:hypothetical protein
MPGPFDLQVARVVVRAARALGPTGRRWSRFQLREVEPPWRPFCVLGALQRTPPEGPMALWRAACLLDVLARDARLGPPEGGGLDEAVLGSPAAQGLPTLRWTDVPSERGSDVRRFLRAAARVAEGRFAAGPMVAGAPACPTAA